MTAFLEALGRVPPLLAQHLLLAAAALLLGLAISLPLAVWAARRRHVRRAVLGLASLIQTIPSLALLALTLYAVLPILRNAVTGIVGLDPAVIEAADAVGMTAWQKLRLVEAPLVAPLLMAGIRTAAVWTIGAATLSTTVGQPSLGDMIFAGLQTQNWALVLAGCAAAAALALAVDALLGVIEHGIAARRRWAVIGALGVLVAGVGIALAPLVVPQPRAVVIGAKDFSEQYILARLIGARLERAGYRVTYREGLGSAVVFNALAAGDLDVYVDYGGTIWTNQMHRADTPPRATMLAAIRTWARHRHGVSLVGPLGFENAYAFAVRADTARVQRLRTLDDLARASPGLTLGSDMEFLERPEWAAVRRVYPIHFAQTHGYNPTFMYRALQSGQADVISAFSSDGRIAAEHLTVLTDPRGAIPAYDAILLTAPARVHDARFIAALKPLVGRIPVETMRQANYLVDRDHDQQSPEAAAKWLEGRIAP